jgi:hypothetical protein
MFEFYTERARRVIFFARYEASMYGSETIESEHLLLGLIREDKNALERFAPGSAEDLRKKLQSQIVTRPKISTSIDLPLSSSGKRILAYAHEETQRLNHRHIGTEHLLLGILRESTCLAAQVLGEIGMELDVVRVELSKSGEASEAVTEEEPPPADRPSVNALVDELPEGALARAKWMLERLLSQKSRAPRGPERRGTLEFEGYQGSFRRDTEGKVKDGRFTSTRLEDRTTVVETHHFCNGHQISITERFRMGEDGKTLSYSQEVVGPKPEQQHKHAMEFDVS